MGGFSFSLAPLKIPASRELVANDGISDKWEADAVAAWNQQFGESQPMNNTFFQAADDKELLDPDGTNNSDGGTNLPEHKTAGDGLTVLQEYRGFILDGGGFDGAGQNGHTGGHKRLRPSLKELLVEVDSMVFAAGGAPGIQNQPPGGINGVLTDVARGFSHSSNGAGVSLYWVRDQSALAHQHFINDDALSTYMVSSRSQLLKIEFVHLLFAADAASPTVVPATGGVTIADAFNDSEEGSIIFIDRANSFATQMAFPFGGMVVTVTAHELTHLLIRAPNPTKWNSSEHETDPAGDGTEKLSVADRESLVMQGAYLENRSAIKYSFDTRVEIDLLKKDGVVP